MNVFYSLDVINVHISIINTLSALNKPKGITLNLNESSMTCKSSFLTIFF